VMSVLRLALVIAFRLSNDFIPHFWAIFLLGVRYDTRMVCISLLVIFLLGTLPVLDPFKNKWGKKISFILWSVLLIIFIIFYTVDFANYAYLSQRVTASLLNYWGDKGISTRMIWQTYHVGWVVLGLIIVGILLFRTILFFYNKTLHQEGVSSKGVRILWNILFFCLLALGIFGRAGQFPLRWSDAFVLDNDYSANIALNPFESFFSTLNFRHSGYDAEKVREHYAWMVQYLGVDHPDSNTLNFERKIKGNGTTSRPNVVLVICESFSMYKSSMVNNPLNTTPFFNDMCNRGIFFNRCFTPAYGTARGIWATVTGVPDVEWNKTSSRNPAAVDQHSVINDFKGYEKYYFIGGSASWANIRGLLTNNISGLHLFEQENYAAKTVDVWGISDKHLFLEANKNLAKENKPFFAVIQTADNHRPYTIPNEDLAEFKKKDVPADTLRKYGFDSKEEYNAFRYTDFCYRKFMEAAQKEKYFRNTIFVFVGDHGIRGNAGNMLPKAFTTTGLTNMYVPLLFYSPAILHPAGYNFTCSQLDILPTIADLCGISYTNTTLGENLLSPAHLSQPNHYAFTFDVDNKIIGVVGDEIYYGYQVNNQRKQNYVSMVDNKVPAVPDSLKEKMHFITDAFYETSRYLILSNKKNKKR
jgi:phosphoglycerol transferase MdoB-like AlkP superfamily enzyme